MQNFNKWAVCLDLTNMDDLLVGYVNYLASILKPEEVRFVHIIETDAFSRDLTELFPELDSEEDLEKIVSKKINKTIDEFFTDKNVKTSIGIRKGNATNQIIKMMDEQKPDMLVIGKKNSYIGEGVVARRLVKYVPSSLLFVPENARYLLNHITVPVDFSKESAVAVQLADDMVKKSGGAVTAQHIYQYPKQFFPYLPDENALKKIDEHVEKEKQKFIDEYKLNADLDVELTLHREGKMSDEIYDLCVHKKSDMIVVAYKPRKNFVATLKDNLADRMTVYNFGLPILVVKNKEKNLKFFEKILG